MDKAHVAARMPDHSGLVLRLALLILLTAGTSTGRQPERTRNRKTRIRRSIALR